MIRMNPDFVFSNTMTGKFGVSPGTIGFGGTRAELAYDHT